MRWLTVAAVAALAIGCGDSGPKLVPVSGTVTLDGKPLKGALVSFLPDTSNKTGQAGEDVTGGSGNYRAMTNGRTGLVPGKYKVVITKSAVDPSEAPEEFQDDPFMHKLSVEGPDGSEAKARGEKPIKGEFDREVPATGGEQDFDVKT
jgi:hypothetical protein